MSASDRHLYLINRLYDLSIKGVLDWIETPAANEFAVSFPQSTVSIAAYQADQPDEMDYYIKIGNAEGSTVETISDVELIADLDDAQKRELMIYQKMGRIYEIARRRALGADKALEDVIANLDSIEDIPF